MSDAEPVALGPILDELGVTADMADGDRITEALVLMKTLNLNTGEVALGIASNDLDWIAQGGLMFAATQAMNSNEPEQRD